MPPGDNLPARRRSDADILRSLKHYLRRREEGKLFYEACRMAGVGPDTVKRYRRDHPDFAEAERVAISEGVEMAEKVLRDKAHDGDMQALTKFLEANDERYRKTNVTERSTVVVISADNSLEKVQLLKEQLQRRQREMPEAARGVNPFVQRETFTSDDDIVDAEIVE